MARQTRILNDRKYFDYPLTPVNAMLGVGLAAGTADSGKLCGGSFQGRAGARADQ